MERRIAILATRFTGDLADLREGSPMFPEHPDFHRLEFGYSTIGRPQIDERSIRVRVRHLSVSKGFPGHDKEKLYKEATVVFEDGEEY